MRIWGNQIKIAEVPGEEVFGDAARDGLKLLELRALTRLGVTISETDFYADSNNQRRIATLAERYGIELAYHAPQGDAWSFGAFSLRIAAEKLRECILRASSLNARHMTLHLGIDTTEPREASITRGALALEEVAPLAEREGVTLCVENVFEDSTSVAYPHECQTLLDAVQSGILRFTLDTGHANVYDCLFELLEVMKDHLAFIHLHDNDGKKDQHFVPGHGTIDWDRFVLKLDEIGYGGPLCLELREECSFPKVISAFPTVDPGTRQ